MRPHMKRPAYTATARATAARATAVRAEPAHAPSGAIPLLAATMLAAAIVFAGMVQAGAQGRVDPKRGEAVARAWCMNCHLISQDEGHTVSADAPPFSALSIAEGHTDERLRGVLSRPHGSMEGFDLDKRQIEDLIAYIRTQAP